MTDEIRARQELGRRIKRLRRAKDLTIKDLAQEAGMSAGYLSEVERGGSALSGEKIAAIAGCLGCSVDYFLTGVAGFHQTREETVIPAGLAEAARSLDLSYVETTKLLAGKRSLVAKRGSKDDEWSANEWLKFHEKVKQYL